ncbi:MAG TPA: hypothetical protein VFT29_14710 [Gemmatimonadaceae bacterium]|nr:hypothetical protein [Gemmatimonadaceae bacterium]
MRFRNAIVALVVILPAAVAAQTTDSLSLQGRHMLAVGLGATGTREASTSASGTTARATGVLATLSYARFVSPSLAIEVAATAFDASASVSSASTRASAATALLIGLRYAPPQLAITPAVRPYVSAAGGPYLRGTSTSGPAGINTTTQFDGVARLGAGASFHIARHVVLGLEGDYHAVRGFDVAASDPTGLSLTVGLGFTWGR